MKEKSDYEYEKGFCFAGTYCGIQLIDLAA